jgi:hypothetical protein
MYRERRAELGLFCPIRAHPGCPLSRTVRREVQTAYNDRMAALRMLIVLGFVLLLAPLPAGAVTVRDIIELSKAGLGDEVLIAVIDADRTIFTLDKDQILELKKAGVSKAVLLKMLRTRTEFEVPLETSAPQPLVPQEVAAPQPEIVVIGAQPAPPPVTVVVPQYYVVPFSIWGVPTHAPRVPAQPVLPAEYRGFGRFINDGWVDRRH